MKRWFQALVLVLTGVSLAACLAPTDDAESGSDALSAGCPKKPDCDDRSDSGELCLPACAEECRTRHGEVGFWVTPYEVEGTFDLGRHQGIAIVGVEYSFDARARLSKLDKSDKKKFAWPSKNTIGDLPSDMADSVFDKDSHDHKDFALCEAPAVTFDRPLANHGRSLSRDPRDKQSRLRLEHLSRDVKPEANSSKTSGSKTAKGSKDATASKSISPIDRAAACLAKITNGFCDSVCGNCSYVLPTAAIMTSTSGDWSEPGDVVHDGGGCKSESYYGGPQKLSQEDVFGTRYPNPFTHCALPGCSANTEAPSLKSLISSAPMTGVYGHNSNTDAEAELLAFQACIAGADDVTSACKACGSPVATQTQAPCISKTNTAANFWKRTGTPKMGGLFNDVVPPVRRADAGGSLESPQCAWGHFPVHGM